MLVETARMWEDLGFYADDGRFHLHSVTGPDEYTTVVNDNTYTNLMARLNLNYAAASRATDARASGPRPTRRSWPSWSCARRSSTRGSARRPRCTCPTTSGAAFIPRTRTSSSARCGTSTRTPPDRFPLLLHYHPLVIYRHQVIKQADVVLAMFLLGNEFSQEQKRANFDYYDALTTGDSSLSACIQSIVAAEIGEREPRLTTSSFALLMDLADASGNTSDGVHIASAAGVWQALVFGFGGVREYDGALSFGRTSRPPGTR